MWWRSGQFCFAFAVLGLCLLYKKPSRNDAVLDIAAIWDNEVGEPIGGPRRILVGVNANLDMIVSAVDLLKALDMDITLPCDHSNLSSTTELEQLVAFSMLHCAGIERVFTHQSLFDTIVNIAASLPHVYHIGGNAALIAEKIKSTFPEIEVMLVGPLGNTLRNLLHKDIVVPVLFGNTSKDEIHMILEYSAGVYWGNVKSSCANRVIFSHDVSNSKMIALEYIADHMHQFTPDLVVLSGAHLLSGEKPGVWKKRLNDTAEMLETTLHSVPVHWELATIGNLHFFKELAHHLFPRINSLGLNEQELLSVAKSSNAPFDFNSMPHKPSIELVSDLLHWLMMTYSSLSDFSSTLTRVHFHSLSFHVIATIDDGPWHNGKEAVMAGAKIAGLQACDTSSFSLHTFKVVNPEEFRVTATDIPLSKSVMTIRTGFSEWLRDGIRYHFSPVLVCNNPRKTVGLGDAISSLGLVYSRFI